MQQLLGMGFRKELDAILQAMRPTSETRQTLLFSATFPEDVFQFAKSATRRDGTTCFVDAVGVGVGSQTNTQVKQCVTVSAPQAQGAELFSLLRQLASGQLASSQQGGSQQRGGQQAGGQASGQAGGQAGGQRAHKVLVFFSTTRMVQFYASLIRHASEQSSSTAGNGFDRGSVGGLALGPGSATGASPPLRILEIHARLSQVARKRVAEEFRKSSKPRGRRAQTRGVATWR